MVDGDDTADGDCDDDAGGDGDDAAGVGVQVLMMM